MTKKEFSEKLVEAGIFSFKKESEEKFNKILDVISEVLQSGEELNFIGWGKFAVIERAPRTCKNPKTGEEIKVDAKKIVKFKAGKALEVIR